MEINMDAVKIMAMAIVGIMLSLVLKEQKQYLGIAVAIISSVCLFFMLLPYLEKVVSYIKILSSSLDNDFIGTILKVTGIGVLTTLSSNLCRDGGFSAIASIVMFSGKAICMCLVLPVIGSFLLQILSILP